MENEEQQQNGPVSHLYSQLGAQDGIHRKWTDED